MVNNDFLITLLLTLRLAMVTTLVLLTLGLPLAYGLSQWRSRLKPLVEALVAMPLVLPPTVLGFYLLLAFSPQSWLGGWLERCCDWQLVFSFPGLVVGSVIYSLPFMVQPLQSGFEQLPPHLAEASFMLGKSRWMTFWRVQLPNARGALLTAAILTFAHTVGEFGVILMIGGNIPGETRVASIAIYDEVESLQYDQANQYALVLFIFAFLILVLVNWTNRYYPRTGRL
jgi:molybdate transport system permease protein